MFSTPARPLRTFTMLAAAVALALAMLLGGVGIASAGIIGDDDNGNQTPANGTPSPEDGTPTPEDGTPTPEDGTPTPDDADETPTPDAEVAPDVTIPETGTGTGAGAGTPTTFWLLGAAALLGTLGAGAALAGARRT